ncbi:MAG TPA: FG-GAP-like repeat-containing protein [Chryseosolibacter sp.]
MKRSILYILISVLLATEFATAQTTNPVLWQRRTGPIGGAIYDIEYDATTQNLYAIAGERRKLFVSQDNGDNWDEYTSSGSSFYYFNDIEITNNTIYLTSSYDIWSSPAANQNWEQITSQFYDFSNANKIKRLSTGRLVVLANAGIFFSTNNGSTWTEVNLTGSLNGSYLVKTSADQLFIVKDQKPFRSNDFGATWTEFSTGLPGGFQAHSIWANNDGSAIYCVTGDNIYTSNGTGSWSSIKGGSITDATISSFSSEPSVLEFTADGLGMYFVDNVNHKLHSKTLSGAAGTWAQRQITFPTASSTITNITAKDYPSSLPTTSTVFFGTRSGVIKTTNGGTTYADANTNLSGVDSEDLLIDMSGGGSGALLMVANNQSALLKSTSQGDTWSTLSGFSGSIYNITQNTTRTVLYMVTSAGAVKSINAGTNWSTVTTPSGPQQFYAADNDKVFAVSGSTIYYSPSQGNAGTWVTPTITGLPGGSGYALNQNQIAVANANRMMLRVYDYNTSTYKLYRIAITYTGPAINSMVATEVLNCPITDLDDISRMYGAKGNFYLFNPYSNPDQLAVSADGGATWSSTTFQAGGDMFVTHNGYVFYPGQDSDNYELAISRDNGATFQISTFDENPKPNTYDIEAIAIDNDGYAYVAVSENFVYRSKKNIVLPDAVPASLTEVGRSATAVALRWDDNASNEDVFEVFYSSNGIDFTKSGEGDDYCNTPNDRDFFVVTGLHANTSYTFRVRAKNEAGSTAAAQIVATTLNSCAQTIPDNRSWSAVNVGGSGGYAVTTPKTVNIRHLGGGKYEITDMSLRLIQASSDDAGTFFESCGQTFAFGSDEVRSNGNGTWNGTNALTLKWRTCGADKTETINLTLNATDPAPVAPVVRAYTLSNNSIEVNWMVGAYQKTYIVERATGTPTTFTQVGTVNYPEKKFIDNTGLVAGTTYFYRVKARNGNASPLESAYSGNASIVFNTPKFVVPANTLTSYVAVTLGSYWGDFNNDGFDDYFTLSFDPVSEKGTPIFFRNNGAGDFVQTAATGVVDGEPYFSATIIDYDNDGKLDIAFSGQDQVVFDVYKGNGDFSFNKVTSSLGALATIISEDGEITSISWGDLDNDGLLDLMVLTSPSSGSGGRILLYHQNANHTFTKIDGGYDMKNDLLEANGATWADYDNDGFQDALIINSGGAFRLYRNNGDLTFEKKTGIGLSASNAITAAWADYNNDGHIDLYVGNTSTNTLFKNDGDGTFTQEGATSISEANTNISASWGDFNNDGFLDLITAGFLSTQTRLFMRDATSPGSLVFTKHITEKINDLSVSHFGVSTADYDNDGRLDAALSGFEFTETSDGVSSVNTNLFRNNSSTGNWSEVRLNPTSGNEQGVGASIKLTAGGVTQLRQIQAGSTYVSKNTNTAHFGIGAATTITNIQVTWANGQVQNYPNPPKNQILVIDQDVDSPDITSVSPTNNSTNISTNTTVTITFDEEAFAVGGKMLLLYRNTDLSTPILGINVTDAVKSGSTFSFTFPSNLLTGVKYNISVDAGAFVDKYGNASDESPTGNWAFTTAAGPVSTALVPANGSTNVAANTALQITFDKNVTAVAGKRLKIMDGTSAILDIDVGAQGSVTNTVYSLTPSVVLPTNKLLKVTVDAGAFKDAATQAEFNGIALDAWNFTTAVGPAATTLSPAHNATNVAINTALQITFDKNVSTVAGKKLKVLDGSTTIIDIDVSTTGTVTNNIYSFTPASSLPTDKALRLVVDAGAFIDPVNQTTFTGIALDSWNFRTALAPDVTAPVISFLPPLTAAKGFNNLNSPEITVTDDRGTVSSVVISIKKLTAASSTFVEVPAIQGTGANANKWVFTISESNHFDAIGTEYFITAKDPANNAVRSPADANATHKLYLTYTANESKIPSDKLGFGGAVSNWKVFSIPFDLGVNNSFTTIFNELDGKENKVDYRFLTIQPTANTNWTEYPSFTTITRGQGYFSNIKTPVDILLGPLQAPENSRTNLFTINLKAGWNMVGNPYLTQISWANVKDFNGLTGQVAELHKFNGSTYPVAVQTLDPYEGGFVFAQADRTVTIPFLGQTASGGRLRYEMLSEDINDTEWLLKLNVKQGEIINDLGSIGMAADARLGLDDYDGVSPPRFLTFLETNFAHPEHFAKRFTRDIVPTQDTYTWNFTVDSNLEGEAQVSWDNSSFADGSKEIVLLDVARQVVVDMRKVSSYSFNPKESVNFKVYFGENLKIAPETVLLGKAFPNPTSGNTNIAFSLPDSGGQDQFVTLDILDATGRTLGTIAQGRYQPGFYEAVFNAKELNNGFYTYRLTVQNARGRNTIINKLIIK